MSSSAAPTSGESSRSHATGANGARASTWPTRRLLVVLFVLLALVSPWWNIPRDQADSAGMMAHLHAFFVDRDLLYDDEYARLGMSPLFAFVTDEGVVSNHWPAGATWLQAPGWGLGVLAAHVAASFGVGKADAMGVVALLGLRAWAMVVLAGIAWLVSRLVASSQDDAETREARRAGAIVAACFVFGTPLWHYASEDPLRPHLWGAAVVLALVAISMRPTLGTPHERVVLMAALAGLATYVRPQLAPVLLLVVPDVTDGTPRERLSRAALALGVFAVFPLAHLRSQAWMYGDQLGQYAGDVSYHVVPFLFSTHHGVFTWCPVLVIGVFAVARSATLRERGAWIVLLVLATQIWMDSGMREIEPRTVLGTRTWSGGLAFGPRKLVDVLPLLVPSIAALVADARRHKLARVLLPIAILLSLPTVLLHASAWIDPGATTGGVMGAAEYRDALLRPLQLDAWWGGYQARALPWTVPAVVTACASVPLLALAAAVARARHHDHVGRRELPLTGPVVMVAALVVHGWLAVLLVRSEAALAADPDRMVRAAAAMTAPHVATVQAIPTHHAALRERLGPAAAPPVRD